MTAPLTIVPAGPGLVGFGRDVDVCVHVPDCGGCRVEVADRSDLLNALEACRRLTSMRPVRLAGYVVDEADVTALLDALNASERRAS